MRTPIRVTVWAKETKLAEFSFYPTRVGWRQGSITSFQESTDLMGTRVTCSAHDHVVEVPRELWDTLRDDHHLMQFVEVMTVAPGLARRAVYLLHRGEAPANVFG